MPFWCSASSCRPWSSRCNPRSPLVSITDGKLFLDAARFARGQLLAIDIGRSVSRIGRDAQPVAMREVATNLRLEISHYDDIKDFARFGAILDEATKRQLGRGERIEKAPTSLRRAS